MNSAAPLAITGATGLLGRALLGAATRHGIRVRALSRKAHPDSSSVTWVRGDISDAAAVAHLADGCGALVHAAATMQGSDDEIYRSIVDGTASAASTALGAGVPLVQISSLAVVDPAQAVKAAMVGDDLSLDPAAASRGGYSRGKIEAEQLVNRLRSDGLIAAIIRPAQLVGDQLGSVPPSIGVEIAGCRMALARMTTPLPLVHVDDVAAAILLIAASAEPPPSVNLVDPLRVRRRALLRRLRQDGVPGSDLPLIPVGPLVQPVARLLAPIVPGALGRAAHRVATIESRASWQCETAIALGWKPTNLEPWMRQTGSESSR